MYLRDFTTNQLAALRNQSDRNIRGVRSTILGQIEKKVLMILVDRQGENFPSTNGNLTLEELDFLLRHEEEIPATMEKLNKEKLALLKEIGLHTRQSICQRIISSKKKVSTVAKLLLPPDRIWNSAHHNARTSTMCIRAEKRTRNRNNPINAERPSPNRGRPSC